MKLLFGLARLGLMAALAVSPSYGTTVALIGNSYTSPNFRAQWISNSVGLPLLTPDDVVLTGAGAECVNPCLPSYATGTSPVTVNVGNSASGITFSGVRFVGTNSGTPGFGLFVRPINDGNSTRNNNNYSFTNGGLFPLWTSSLATVASSPSGTATITITLPTGTRSAGFDFGNLNANSNVEVRTTYAGGSQSVSATNFTDKYNASAGTYSTTGPGFYGVTNSSEDITIIQLTSGSNNAGWVLNIANFRFYVQAQTPTPEPSTFLAMGSALILISFLLRRRGKFARGDTA